MTGSLCAGEGAGNSVGQLLRYGESQLNSSQTRRLDAEVLLATVLHKQRSYVMAHPERSTTLAQQARLRHLIAERRSGVPVAYLVGRKEFWSLDFQVDRETLIPRPETELLVEIALATIAAEAITSVADLGTGCGAIALAIAQECQHCRIIAVDCSAPALAVAQRNAVRFGIHNVQFAVGDWYNAVGEAQFEMILSNPPYLSTSAPELHGGDIRYEPRGALVAGSDGLDAIRLIIAGAAAHLRAGGWLILEHAHEQAPGVRALLGKAGFANSRTHRDLAGLDRVTTASAARP